MKISRFLVFLFALVLCASCKNNDKSIVIFFDNDVHCNIDGYPYLAGLRDQISSDTAYVATVSSGDYIQGGTIGSISRGEAIMSIIKEMNYDVIALGNHEFDYDVQHILNLSGDIDAPVVCSNLVDSTGANVFDPYRILSFGKKKVAFIGVTTPNTYYARPTAFKDVLGNVCYDFSRYNLYEKVQGYVDEVKKKDADYVILLTHIGEDPDSISIDSKSLIEHIKGVTALFDAHTHSVVPPHYVKDAAGENVLIAQTGAAFQNVGRCVISKDGKITAELLPIFAGDVELCPRNEHMKLFVDSISDYYGNITELHVGHSDFDLEILDEVGNMKVRRMETNAGDIVADAIRYFAQSDVALLNSGAIRNQVVKGQIKRGNIIAMCPYDNNIVSITVTGKQLVDILQESVKFLPLMHGNFPQVSGVRFRVEVKKDAVNEVKDVEVIDTKTDSYKKIVLDKDYSLATTDYSITSEPFAVLNGDIRDFENHHVLYSDCVINLISELYGGEVPSEYQTATNRMIVE